MKCVQSFTVTSNEFWWQLRVRNGKPTHELLLCSCKEVHPKNTHITTATHITNSTFKQVTNQTKHTSSLEPSIRSGYNSVE